MSGWRYGALALLVGACGGSASSGAGSSSSGASGTSGSSGSASGGVDGGATDSGGGDANVVGDGAAPGTGTISGGPGGVPFTFATAVWIGAPDDPTTTVVYIFSKPVDCTKLHPAGWADDGRIAAGTQFLEIKMKGTTAPDKLEVLGGAATNLAPHEASVNYSLTSLDGGPSAENISNGGTVTLAAVRAGVDVTGTFSVTFGTTTVDGTYDAAFCPGGTEP